MLLRDWVSSSGVGPTSGFLTTDSNVKYRFPRQIDHNGRNRTKMAPFWMRINEILRNNSLNVRQINF